MQRKQIFAVTALLMIAGAAFADAPNINNVVTNFEVASNGVSAKLVVLAKQTAVSAVLFQWLVSYWKDLFKPDIPDALLKAAGMITWFGATMFMIDQVDLVAVTFKQYLALAGELSGMSSSEFTPWGVIVKGRNVIDVTHAGISAKLGGNWYEFGQNMLASGTLLIVDVIVIAAFLILGLSLFVVNVEFWLIFAVAPLAFGLIPLQAFRDQGIAPIKGVISVGLRALILGVIIAVAQSLSDTLIASINANGIPGDPNSTSVLARMLEYLAGMLGCAAMAMYAGKIASAIASGSATFTGSDAMRAGAAMTAGVGALVAGASASATGIGRGALSGMNGAKAVGEMASNAMERASANPFVTPTAGNSGGTGFGQPIQNQPPSRTGNSGAGHSGALRPPLVNSGASSSGAGSSGASSSGASSSGAGSSGGTGFGKPLESRPGVPLFGSGVDAPESGNAPAPASIGGAGSSGASALERFKRSSDRLIDNMKHDHANVSVKINLGAGDK